MVRYALLQCYDWRLRSAFRLSVIIMDLSGLDVPLRVDYNETKETAADGSELRTETIRIPLQPLAIYGCESVADIARLVREVTIKRGMPPNLSDIRIFRVTPGELTALQLRQSLLTDKDLNRFSFYVCEEPPENWGKTNAQSRMIEGMLKMLGVLFVPMDEVECTKYRTWAAEQYEVV